MPTDKTMPTLEEIRAFLSAVPTTTALIILAGAACAMVMSRDWRLSISTLIAHYLLGGLLMTRVIRLDIAMVKTVVGMMVCLTLYITARRAEIRPAVVSPDEASPPSPRPRWLAWLPLDSGWLFRLLVAILGLATAATLVDHLALWTMSTAPREVFLACIILFTEGLLALCLAEEPLKGGLGLLTLLIGFDLFYIMIVQSLIVVGLMGLVNFSIALAIAYLTTLHAGVSPEAAT